jgi:hypothetical protein
MTMLTFDNAIRSLTIIDRYVSRGSHFVSASWRSTMPSRSLTRNRHCNSRLNVSSWVNQASCANRVLVMTYKPNHDAPLHQTRHRNSAIQAASGLYDVIGTIVYDGYDGG